MKCNVSVCLASYTCKNEVVWEFPFFCGASEAREVLLVGLNRDHEAFRPHARKRKAEQTDLCTDNPKARILRTVLQECCKGPSDARLQIFVGEKHGSMRQRAAVNSLLAPGQLHTYHRIESTHQRSKRRALPQLMQGVESMPEFSQDFQLQLASCFRNSAVFATHKNS